MDAEQDRGNFLLEISLDLGSSEHEFQEIEENTAEYNELDNFVSNLESENMEFHEESAQFVNTSKVADDKSKEPPPKNQRKKKKRQFNTATEEKQDQYANGSVEPSTHKQTTWAVNILKGKYRKMFQINFPQSKYHSP